MKNQYTYCDPFACRPTRKFSETARYLFLSCSENSDGCAYYRSKFVSDGIRYRHRNCFFIEAENYIIPSDAILNRTTCYRVQRICGESNHSLFQTLMSARQRHGFRLLYDIDDILIADDIPLYNCYRPNFVRQKHGLDFFFNGADIVTVTTPQLREYYLNKLAVDPEKVRVIPNYISPLWSNWYFPGCAAEKRARHQERPRVGFCAAASHLASGSAAQQDDFSEIVPWIIAKRKEYRFVFLGGINAALSPYADDFEIHSGVPFLAYPAKLHDLDLDLLIAPLADNLFNRCKSGIKILEGWSVGIPVLAQDLPGYREIAPEACFDSAAKLDILIAELFASPEKLQKSVDENYRKLEKYWIHNHADEWLDAMI